MQTLSNDEEIFWGQFFSLIHELAEQIRAKKTGSVDIAYQGLTTDPATHQITEVTQPLESTLLAGIVKTEDER